MKILAITISAAVQNVRFWHKADIAHSPLDPFRSAGLTRYHPHLDRGKAVRRREFLAVVSSAAIWPVAGHAQAVRRIGILVPLPATDPIFRRNMDTFTTVMKGAGWIEGRNLEIRTVSILGSGKSPADAATDVLSFQPDVLVAVTPIAAEALHQRTTTVPVVFVVGWFNPVEKGFVVAINQPAGNMTGITDLEPSLGGKWLQLLKQIRAYNGSSGDRLQSW